MKGQDRSKLKIAMLGHKRIPSREGGVEIVVEELSVRMAELGHQVTCYNRRGHHVSGAQFDLLPKAEYRGVHLKSVWTIDAKGLAAVSSSFFAALMASLSPAEVVHIHAEGPAFMCWIPKLFGKRVVVTVHGLDWQREKWKHGFGARFIHWGEKMAVRFADEIIVLSKNIQGYFQETYHRDTVFIPNGVCVREILAADEITQQYGLKKDEYILFLGRLVPEKGIHYLLEAFQGILSNKKLVIAGGSSDSDLYVKELSDYAQGNPNVLFTGFVQGRLLKELYSNAYIYVLPSDVEGMPLSLLEAMSYGNCCVVSDIPECAEVVGDHAVLFQKSNVRQLQASIQNLCDDPERVASYKRAAQSYICKKYNWDYVVNKTLEIYR